MQIHEITQPIIKEGVLGNIGRGLASGIAGVDIPQSQSSIERDAAQAYSKLQAQGYRPRSATAQTQRIVVNVLQPGQSIPAKYYKKGNIWTNELGAVITDLRQKAYLDKLIPTHGKREIVPAEPTSAPATRKVSRRRIAK